MLEARKAFGETAIACVLEFAEQLAHAEDDPATDVTGMVQRLFGDGPEPEVLDRLAAAVPALPGANARVYVTMPADRERHTANTMTGAKFHRLAAAVRTGLRTYPGSFVGTNAVSTLAFDLGAGDCADALHHLANHAMPDAFTLGLSETVRYETAALGSARDHALAAAELAALDPVLQNPASWGRLGACRAFTDPGCKGLLDQLDGAGMRASTLVETLEKASGNLIIAGWFGRVGVTWS